MRIFQEHIRDVVTEDYNVDVDIGTDDNNTCTHSIEDAEDPSNNVSFFFVKIATFKNLKI